MYFLVGSITHFRGTFHDLERRRKNRLASHKKSTPLAPVFVAAVSLRCTKQKTIGDVRSNESTLCRDVASLGDVHRSKEEGNNVKASCGGVLKKRWG